MLGFPYLWVNSEKYVFSPEVLDAGAKLVEAFYKVQHVIRHAYSRTMQESPDFSSKQLKQEISGLLEDFDQVWVRFEKVSSHFKLAIRKGADGDRGEGETFHPAGD